MCLFCYALASAAALLALSSPAAAREAAEPGVLAAAEIVAEPRSDRLGPEDRTLRFAEAMADIAPASAKPPAQRPAVTVAKPVGRVVVAQAGDALGERRYVSRVTKDGVTTVRFMRSSRTSGRSASFGPIMGTPSGSPLENGRLTSGFGYRQHPISGRTRLHAGVDLAAPSGTPVRSTSDGVVMAAGWMGGYGLTVRLDHGGGIETRYAHMSRLAVAPDQTVKRGDVIGYVGSTGNSTGPHLHYEVRSADRAINPLQ